MGTQRPVICVVAPFPFPIDRGSPLRAANFIGLISDRYEVHVCTYHLGDRSSLDATVHRIPELPFEFSEAGASYAKAVCDLFLIRTVGRVLRTHNVDVIHAHLHEGCATSTLATTLRRSSVPVVYDAHGTLTKEMIETGFLNEDSITRPFWEFFERRIEFAADHVIAESETRKRALLSKGIPAEAITVVHNQIDTELFSPATPDEELAQSLEIDLDAPTIVYTGSLQDYQGIPDLIEAVSLLVESVPNVQLLLVGPGDIDRYRSLASTFSVEEQVIFTGPEPFNQMPAYLSLGDIGICPRRYGANQPTKLLTYMAAGLAAVTTDIQGIKHLINDENNGIVVPSGAPEELASACERLIFDDELLSSLGTQGRETILTSYSKDVCGAQLEDVYTSNMGN